MFSVQFFQEEKSRLRGSCHVSCLVMSSLIFLVSQAIREIVSWYFIFSRRNSEDHTSILNVLQHLQIPILPYFPNIVRFSRLLLMKYGHLQVFFGFVCFFVPEQQKFTVLAWLLDSMIYNAVFLVAVEHPYLNIHTCSGLDERPVVARLLFALQCFRIFFMFLWNFRHGKKITHISSEKKFENKRMGSILKNPWRRDKMPCSVKLELDTSWKAVLLQRKWKKKTFFFFKSHYLWPA